MREGGREREREEGRGEREMTKEKQHKINKMVGS